jgi:hypothetical protein
MPLATFDFFAAVNASVFRSRRSFRLFSVLGEVEIYRCLFSLSAQKTPPVGGIPACF